MGGNVDYLRSTAEARAYYPVTQDIVLAGRTMGGTIGGWGGQSVRVVDAFYKGGETIPGFAPPALARGTPQPAMRLAAPPSTPRPPSCASPCRSCHPSLGSSGAVFTSAGTLFGTNAQTAAATYAKQHGVKNTLAIQDSSALRSSAGSIVWDSPVGALRVDFADVISKAAGDKTQVVNFGYSGW